MITSVYPLIMSQNIEEQANFFIKQLGFIESFHSDWYISLTHETGFELAFIDYHHETIPKNYRQLCQGIIINIEVDNVDQLYQSILQDKDIPIHLPIRDEVFGQRHFIMEAPGSLLVDVIQVTPPSQEYALHYKEVNDVNQ